jgi:hypothetical protein
MIAVYISIPDFRKKIQNNQDKKKRRRVAQQSDSDDESSSSSTAKIKPLPASKLPKNVEYNGPDDVSALCWNEATMRNEDTGTVKGECSFEKFRGVV